MALDSSTSTILSHAQGRLIDKLNPNGDTKYAQAHPLLHQMLEKGSGELTEWLGAQLAAGVPQQQIISHIEEQLEDLDDSDLVDDDSDRDDEDEKDEEDVDDIEVDDEDDEDDLDGDDVDEDDEEDEDHDEDDDS